MLFLASALIGAVVLAGAASAQPSDAVVDQSSTGAANTTSIVTDYHNYEVAQTFVAGVTGSLTDVDLGLQRESGFYSGNGVGGVRVSITGTASDGSPDKNAQLASADVPETAISVGTSTPVQVTFSAPAALVAGTRYAIYVREVTPEHVHIYVDTITSNGGYASGQRYWDTGAGLQPAGGDLKFATYVIPTVQEVAAVLESAPARMGYCSAAGDTWQDGTPIPVGTYLDLMGGQPLVDVHYIGATPAIYVEGKGLTCDPPPAGFERHGFAFESSLPGETYVNYAS